MLRPRNRSDLLQSVIVEYAKLQAELLKLDAETAAREHPDGGTIRELLAVLVWWTTAVADWIEAGQRGDIPGARAPGDGWEETPRLHADLAAAAADVGFRTSVHDLAVGSERVLQLIATLDDRELLEPGVYPWTGKASVAHWIQVQTATRYRAARTAVRRALRDRG